MQATSHSAGAAAAQLATRRRLCCANQRKQQCVCGNGSYVSSLPEHGSDEARGLPIGDLQTKPQTPENAAKWQGGPEHSPKGAWVALRYIRRADGQPPHTGEWSQGRGSDARKPLLQKEHCADAETCDASLSIPFMSCWLKSLNWWLLIRRHTGGAPTGGWQPKTQQLRVFPQRMVPSLPTTHPS